MADPTVLDRVARPSAPNSTCSVLLPIVIIAVAIAVALVVFRPRQHTDNKSVKPAGAPPTPKPNPSPTPTPPPSQPPAKMSPSFMPRLQGPIVHVPQPAQLPEPFHLSHSGVTKFSAIDRTSRGAGGMTGSAESHTASQLMPLAEPYMDFRAPAYEPYPTAGAGAGPSNPPGTAGAASVNFERLIDAIKTMKPVMTMFYMNGCGPCNAAKPAFHAAAQLCRQRMGAHAPGFAVIERNDAGPILGQLGIQGFPTFVLFSQGRPVSPYNGPRDAESIVQYLQQQVSASSAS